MKKISLIDQTVMKTDSFFSWRACLLAVCATALFLCSFPAGATINVVGYWRMGENDPGATNGSPATNVINSAGATNLLFANATYSTNVASAAAAHVRSSLSINLTNSAYGRTNIVSSTNDNFGIEAWVEPTAVANGNQVIAYNGNTGTSGWGIFIDARTNYAALYGGAVAFSGTPAQQGVWAHVALVRAGGTATLYVNGAAVVTTNNAPRIPTGNFAVGAPPQNPTSQFFIGLVDEVRVFTFSTGQFVTNDLLINAALPTARADTASPLTVTSSTLNGYAFPNGNSTTAWFVWGATTNYGQMTSPVIVTTNSTPVSIAVTGLSAGTTYHYALSVSNLLGTNISQDSMFTVGGFATTAFGLPGIQDGSVAWGDYDNDGRLDILLSGNLSSTSNVPTTQIWHNNGDGTFSLNTNMSLPGVTAGSAAWGDYDNDGRLDILVAGFTASTTNITQIWHNNGNGVFSQNTNVALPAVQSSVSWADYDNDGRLDILLAGSTNGAPSGGIAQIWHNNGDGTFSRDTAVNLPGVFRSSAAWGDYDNDGRLDILLAGEDTNGIAITQIWHNNGNGTFSADTNAVLQGVYFGSVAWGDYDNDGRLDILLEGYDGTNVFTQVWHNDGNGAFSMNTNAAITPVFVGAATWGDYDSDGWLDILATGFRTNGTSIAEIWRNNGDGTFSKVVAGLSPTLHSSEAWGDYDNDGRLDILISGAPAFLGGLGMQIQRNQTLQTNTAPQVPSGLSAEISGTNVIFNWSPSSDSQTPSAGLAYNLRVGSSPGASDIVAPLSATNGFVKVPKRGNIQSSSSVPAAAGFGTHYYWSVQAVDTSFAGSPFAPEQSFQLVPALEPVGGSSPVPGDLNGDGVVDETELAAVLSHLGTNGAISSGNLDLTLRNYLAAYPLVMTNVHGLGSSNVVFTLPNSPDPNLSVQSSTDQINWDTVGPVNYGFIDTNGITNLHRFYRLSYP